MIPRIPEYTLRQCGEDHRAMLKNHDGNRLANFSSSSFRIGNLSPLSPYDSRLRLARYFVRTSVVRPFLFVLSTKPGIRTGLLFRHLPPTVPAPCCRVGVNRSASRAFPWQLHHSSPPSTRHSESPSTLNYGGSKTLLGILPHDPEPDSPLFVHPESRLQVELTQRHPAEAGFP